MRAAPSPIASLFFCILAILFATPAQALTLEELRAMPDLTPRKFAALFSDFHFRFRAEVQDPRAFLASETGDCDDYATLAALILKEKGYTPRLITVRMPNLVHVVCYIEETQSYLDYDNRSYFSRTISCGNDIDEIARKVARANGRPWSSASEFTFAEGMKRLVQTVTDGQPRNRAFAGLLN